MRVDVVCAESGRERFASIELDDGATIADAIASACQTASFTGLDVAGMLVGIFGKLAQPDCGLRDGDRVEIYRSLAADPLVAPQRRSPKKGKPASF